MSALFLYLIKANIALCLFYLAYRLGLRRLTFYTLNRYFLLSGIVFSSVFPLVDVNDFFHRHETLAQQAVIYLPDLGAWQQPAGRAAFSAWDLVEWVFWAGVAVMAIRLMMQLVSLLFLHRKTDVAHILDRKVRLMRTSMNPFSFFRHIYVNPSLHGPDELKAILQHESIHVREWHSADVLMSELNQVFYWFNPGAWLMKTAVKENLEFLTDRSMLRAGADRKAYQYSLVQVSAAQYAAGIANNFNFSHLKNRISMMNKERSSRLHITRYAILGCIVCGILLSLNFTRAGTVVQEAVKDVQRAMTEPADTVPAAEEVTFEVGEPSEKPVKLTFSPKKSPEKISVTPTAAAAPGQSVGIRIRGTGDTSHPPLIVLDGKVLEVKKGSNFMQGIDPGSIESITVLKDASATAIYGKRAQHGVIIINSNARDREPRVVTVAGYPTPRGGAVKVDGGNEDDAQRLKEITVVGYGPKEAAEAKQQPLVEEIRLDGPNGPVKVEEVKLDNAKTVIGKNVKVEEVRLVDGKMVPVENIRLEDVMAATKAKEAATGITAIKAYPNPSNGIVNVSFGVKDKVEKGYIEVTDASGKPVYQKPINGLKGSYNGQIDLSRFPAGIYYLVIVKDGAKVSSKIVRQ